ncbi:MAG: hypothetical protein D6713_05310 [Deltaproteobacteria bacterium]|nr:MAG: hypothetical protein D6713_05310 [Deltaproteobacteria bacterium]
MKVGVKFCGGCNPEYDWLGFWEKVRSSLDGRVEWVRWDDGDASCLLVLNGCFTACGEREVEESPVSLPRAVVLPGTGVDDVTRFLDGKCRGGEEGNGEK